MHQSATALRQVATPRFARSVVRRDSLERRLDILTPVTVIQGLPGTGKTTLAASWADRRRARGDVIWWFNAADSHDHEAILRDLRAVRLRASRVRILIVDDAHYFSTPRILAELVRELRQEPDLHVVLCTRDAHPIVRLAAVAGVMTNVLTGAHLHARADEIPSFAASWGHAVDQERARELYRELGGWLSVLRRSLDDTHPERDPRGEAAVAAYLRNEVLPQIGDDRALLRIRAVAATGYVDEELLRALCRPGSPLAALIDAETVPGLLKDYSRHGFIEPAREDDSVRWRFPSLLASFLAEGLDSEYSEITMYIHQATATWLAQREGIDRAGSGGLIVSHARAAGDWPLLARIWNERGLALTIYHPAEAHRAYHDIPDIVLAVHPELALAASVFAALGMDDGRRASSVPIRNYRDAGWAIHPVPLPPQNVRVLETTAQLISGRHRGDVPAAYRLARTAARQYSDPRSSRDSILHRSWFTLQYAMTAYAAGEPAEAIELLASAAQDARAAEADAISAVVSAQRALMNAMAGNARTAVGHLDEYRRIHAANQWLHYPAHAAAHLADGILRLDRLDPSALDHLDIEGADEIEEWAIVAWARTQHALLFDDPIVAVAEVHRLEALHAAVLHPESAHRQLLDRCLADLYLALGELNRAERHIQDSPADPLTFVVPRARLAFICGDYRAARGIAASHAWDRRIPLRDRIDLVMLKAASAVKMGDKESARLFFSRGYRLADDAGSLLPYASLPDDVRDTLLDLIDNPLDSSDLLRIQLSQQPYPDRGELVVLSPRESIVLRAMAEHETLADVADALVVSLNTVKKQAHAVNTKLGVHDRHSAVWKAQRLGLLPTAGERGARQRERRSS